MTYIKTEQITKQIIISQIIIIVSTIFKISLFNDFSKNSITDFRLVNVTVKPLHLIELTCTGGEIYDKSCFKQFMGCGL